MSAIPKSLTRLIEALSVLPGVGPRSAERYAYFLLKSSQANSDELAHALENLHGSIKLCPATFALIDSELDSSPLYSDKSRDKHVVAVVADTFDIAAIERTGGFNGTYHVLGGLISPIDGIDPESLRIPELVSRLKKDDVSELILALSASVEGESTALYISKQVPDKKVKVTRIARGLPIGLDLEYADQITLGRALEGRQPL